MDKNNYNNLINDVILAFLWFYARVYLYAVWLLACVHAYCMHETARLDILNHK